ncbi:hypothetical protein C0J52_07624 [Blattella germanica]|nr:hypothetical protein C0J52_07624 [Blattella germanica]
MEGLPLLPGYSFSDPTITKYHLSHQFDYKNGYRLPRIGCVGIGKRPLDVDGTAYFNVSDPVRYDPSLTYGRVKQYAVSQVIPHFALYDKKCLTFRSFFKQSVFESPDEHYRIRQVNIIYFLEDDTITVMEPPVDEFLESQGIELNEPEEMPPDPYIQYRRLKVKPHTHITKPLDDKLRRFLEYDGKILRFFAVWDDRETEYGEMRAYVIYYYLADDRVEVQEVHDKNDGRDPFPLLLKKIKLPRDWKDMPVDFPTLTMEKSDEEVTSFYTPKDFLVGETIFILGRRFLIYDTDKFTRKYFQEVLKITQRGRIDVFEKKPPPPEAPIPPHLGFGSPEDSLQSCLTVTIPKPPRKDVVRYVYNINKVVAGEHNLNSNEGTEQRVVVSRAVVHPNYAGDVGPYDIAVLKLSSALTYNQYVQPIALPSAGDIPSGDAILSGWGSTSTTNNPSMPDILQTAVLPIVDYDECVRTYGEDSPLDPSNGDSGGPLAINGAGGEKVLIGVVSWGVIPCGSSNAPSVYTRVSAYNDWIANA